VKTKVNTIESEHKLDTNLLSKKKLPMIRQSEIAECGLACILMVAGYYGNNTSLVEARAQISLSTRGVSIQTLFKVARHFHLSARAVKLDIDGLSGLKVPCILHWDFNHFVVLKEVSKNHVIIHDPDRGTLKLPYSEVSKRFTGVALELSPTSEFIQVSKPSKLKFTQFWDRSVGLKRALAVIFSISLCIQFFALIAPYYIQLVIDKVIGTGDSKLMMTIFVGFLLLLIFEVSAKFLRAYSLNHLGNTINLQLGNNLFHQLIRLKSSYFESRHMGDVLSRFGSLNEVKKQMTEGVIETGIDGLMASLTLVMLFIYSPLLSMVILICTFIYITLRVITFTKFRQVNENELNAQALEQTNFMETLRAITTIKLFNAEQKRESSWQNAQVAAINQNVKMGNFQNVFNTSQSFIFGIENLLVIFVGATLVISSHFTIGMLFAFIAYKRLFSDKIVNLIEKAIEFKMLGLHFNRLEDIVLGPKEHEESLSAAAPMTGEIELRNVCFKYDSVSEEVLKDVSFTIKAGESVAIVGGSGCGKSTLLKLMLGLRSPSNGSILIDGTPLEQFGVSNFRDQIGVIMQEDQIFSGTISDNIALFDFNKDEERVQEVAKLAHIHTDIENMPMKYNSLIGDMGSSLSGGQKQRVLIARALYKKPKVLLMDEATSHLDEELESKLNQTISELKITKLLIAHRKKTIDSADRVISLPSINKV
jgi:ATP-binding cassette subfamily B protein RaxB